jgi:hypothetical protein
MMPGFLLIRLLGEESNEIEHMLAASYCSRVGLGISFGSG